MRFPYLIAFHQAFTFETNFVAFSAITVSVDWNTFLKLFIFLILSGSQTFQRECSAAGLGLFASELAQEYFENPCPCTFIINVVGDHSEFRRKKLIHSLPY